MAQNSTKFKRHNPNAPKRPRQKVNRTFWDTDAYYSTFIHVLEGDIARIGRGDDTALQKSQVEGLIELERQFVEKLKATLNWESVYHNFFFYIADCRRKTLAARPYFRERKEAYKGGISEAVISNNPLKLSSYRVNYRFIKMAMKYLDSVKEVFTLPEQAAYEDLKNLVKKIVRLRHDLVESNLPLAISRVKIFVRKNKPAHLEVLDFVQIASEGLIIAVDKFVPPYTPVFRSVAIGRMGGNFIENSTESMFHFPPVEGRLLYKTNKARKLFGDDVQKIKEHLMKDEFLEKTSVTEERIYNILRAASPVSFDTSMEGKGPEDDKEREKFVEKILKREELTEVPNYEDTEAANRMVDHFEVLTPLEKKVLRLKGLKVP